MHNFVVQKLVKCHQIKPDGRLGTWRTITVPTSENEAIRQLLSMPTHGVFRALSSPATFELAMHAEVTEWTV